MFSTLCLQLTPTSYLGPKLRGIRRQRSPGWWLCENMKQDKKSKLVWPTWRKWHYFFRPEESMGRTRPLCVPLEPEAAVAVAQPLLCCQGTSTDLQHWQVMSQGCFCSFILGENQWNEQGCVCLSSVPHIKAFLSRWSEKVKSIISAAEVAGWTVSQLVCSESQFRVCWEKKMICVLCGYGADQLILYWNGFPWVSKAGQSL